MAAAKRRWSDATGARTLSSLRGFTRWPHRRGYLPVDPLDADLSGAPARAEPLVGRVQRGLPRGHLDLEAAHRRLCLRSTLRCRHRRATGTGCPFALADRATTTSPSRITTANTTAPVANEAASAPATA